VGTRGLTVSHSVEWRHAAVVTDEQAAARVVGQAPRVIESVERIDPILRPQTFDTGC